ncbi:MAG TPA: hypothetical protein VMA36_07525 [Candidatus Limnocylindria bacterium]|jgi:hypothetical protein|nr:hypothetical protein [Candidatus Limnocylindria bacterium]
MAFACENVASEPEGPVSFQNVMDGIAAVDFPATTGRWFAVFCFFSEAARTITNCRVVVADESGGVIAQTALKDLTFTAESPISRNLVGFQGLSWPYPGRYRITFVAERDDVLASFPMHVVLAPPPPAQAGEQTAT